MSDWDFVEDEPEEQEEQQEPEPLDVQKLQSAYFEARPGADRERRWRAFTEDEREALQGIGIAGPIHAEPDERQAHAEPVAQLLKDELRQMDPTARAEAQAEFEEVTRKAEGDFNAGLNAVMRGQLDASQGTLDLLAKIRDDTATEADPNKRSALLQQGARMIERLRNPDRARVFNPGNVTRRRQYVDPLTGRPMLEETDGLGNSRTVQQTHEQHPELYTKPTPTYSFGEIVSVDEFRSWDYPKQAAFMKQHPDHYEALLHAAEDRTDQEANRRVNVR
jgi:hypothetical protein